jgi:hypothetical protein
MTAPTPSIHGFAGTFPAGVQPQAWRVVATPDLTDRRKSVALHFQKTADDLELMLHDYGIDEWVSVAPPDDETNLHRPYGYLPTKDLETLHFSPNLIAAQTAELEEDAFVAYLDVVDVHVLLHVTHYANPDVERIVDKAIYDLAPGSAAVLSEVMMTVLDRAAATG